MQGGCRAKTEKEFDYNSIRGETALEEAIDDPQVVRFQTR